MSVMVHHALWRCSGGREEGRGVRGGRSGSVKGEEKNGLYCTYMHILCGVRT